MKPGTSGQALLDADDDETLEVGVGAARAKLETNSDADIHNDRNNMVNPLDYLFGKTPFGQCLS